MKAEREETLEVEMEDEEVIPRCRTVARYMPC